MRESAVIRWLDNSLVWYPPGSSDDPRPLDDESQLEQLAALAAGRRAPVVFAVPGGDVSLREVSITAAEKRHIAKSLPYMLEDDFATDVDNLHFAQRPLDKLELGVAACTHDAMERWQELLAELPGVSQWIPEPLLLPWQAGELCVVIEAHQVVVRSGANEGFSAERNLGAAMLASLPEDMADAVIVYGLDQGADSELLPAWMRERMQWRTGKFAAALMLAEEERQPLNLRQGDYGANLPIEQWWRQWRLVAGVFGAAFLLQVTSTYANFASLESENLQLRQQIESAYRQVVPRGAVVDPERQLKRQLDELRGGSQSVSFVSLMDRIGGVVAKQPGAQVASINFNDKLGDVRINLVVPDFNSVEKIRSALVELGMDAVTENSNRQGDAVRARLKVSES
ncbi:MAG: type II secretion system protein GspL [Halieaceae bacterium]|nr:type II secretion system protein GspL [Halieaceae bacterium]